MPITRTKSLIQVSHMGGRNHHLLHINRKPELGAELGLEPRHSTMECGYPKWCLNYCAKLLSSKSTLLT